MQSRFLQLKINIIIKYIISWNTYIAQNIALINIVDSDNSIKNINFFKMFFIELLEPV